MCWVKFIFASAFIILFSVGSVRAEVQGKESTYARVMRTGTLRCAYFVVPPEFIKDPNTGKLSGIGYEVTEAAGRLLGLHIDWTEEVGVGEMTTGLSTGRYDAVCSSVFNRAPLARQADFTVPFMYTPVGIFVRADDHRFDKSAAAINDAAVSIAIIDGDTSQEVSSLDFPKAQKHSMPLNVDVSMLLENVAVRKSDVAFTYMANFFRYDQANPGKLKAIFRDKPIRAFGNTIMLPHREEELKSMLNVALSELVNGGIVESIIAKYEPYPGAYYRVSTSYRAP